MEVGSGHGSRVGSCFEASTAFGPAMIGVSDWGQVLLVSDWGQVLLSDWGQVLL